MLDKIETLLLVGCGRMGGALLRGWLEAGLKPAQVSVIDPHPADWLLALRGQGISINVQPHSAPDVVVIATKPQMMQVAVPGLKEFGNGRTLFLSIAAGTLIDSFESMLGMATPIVRAMPNTPAAIGHGVSGIVGNAAAGNQMPLAVALMQAAGHVVELETEDQMHAVTALSGSGPAYVFAMTEALIAAGQSVGLTGKMAQELAVAMVAGSGQLIVQSKEDPAELRRQVTSPNGTTAAGLAELQSLQNGIDALIKETVQAAHDRSIELAQGT